MAKIQITQQFIKDTMQSAPVRAELARKAVAVAGEVDASLPVGSPSTEVSEGTRPRGRPYARVSVEKEPGVDVVETLQTLARVAGRHNAPK